MNNVLKRRRLELNLTLEEVGKKVGVGKSTVRKWENGLIENMGRDKIIALSKALDISPLDILGIEDNDKISNNITHIYNQLNDKNKEQVYEFAEQKLKEQNKIVKLPEKEKRIETIAAHREGKEFTEKEIPEVLDYIEQVFQDQFDK